MKKFFCILAVLLILFSASCASPGTPETPVSCAVSQISKPTLDAFTAFGFKNPEDHVNDGEVQFCLSVEGGIELCGKPGMVFIFHSGPDNTSVLDNPETSCIQYVFAFDDPVQEDYAFTLELFDALRDELGEPEAPIAYLSCAEVDESTLAASPPGEQAVSDLWILENGTQVSLSARAIAAENNQPSGKPCWHILIDFRAHDGSNA